MYVYIYIYVYVCSKITKLFWSNPPSLLELNIALEQQSITFGAKTCFGATVHHFWSKSLFWSNSITFGAKACFGATLHHFWSKSLFWSNAPSLLEQKLVLEQPSITFAPKACFGVPHPCAFHAHPHPPRGAGRRVTRSSLSFRSFRTPRSEYVYIYIYILV